MVRPAALLATLSERERQILELLGKGLSNADIAGVLEVSRHTVKTHVANLLRKLEVSNRAEAVGLLATPGGAPKEQQQQPPAIAVMPFRTEGQSPGEQWQADGIVDDLITHLGSRWFPVIARCSTFAAHKNGIVDARQVGQLLEARFLVEGDYRRSGDRLRLNSRLIDSDNGCIIWGQTYDRRVDDLFDVQFELSAAIVESVEVAVTDTVAGEAARTPAPELAPWELAVRGMSLFWRGTPEQNLEARQVFEGALGRAPNLRLALFGHALSYQRVVVEQWEPDPRAAVGALQRASMTFTEQYPDDAWAKLVAAYASIYTGDRSGAEEKVQRALALEPSSLRGRSLHGQLLAMRGDVANAIHELELALRISPYSPNRWALECAIALAHFANEDYEASIPWAERAARADGAGVMPFGVLASSHAHLGERPLANRAMQSLLARSPNFNTERFRPMVASTRPDIADRFVDGLQMAISAADDLAG